MTGTPGSDLTFINEEFDAAAVTPEQLDLVLADGWRHFGTHFFRYNLNLYRDDVVRVTPLRIRLSDFRLSKSQRRVLSRNSDLRVEFTAAKITAEIEELFDRHKRRFDHSVPGSIYDFLSSEPATVPTTCRQITAKDDNDRLLAVSFFDLGAKSVSAIYGCFDPNETSRSLGIFTMLEVIEYCRTLGRSLYYHGYAYDVSSFYDYKKRFSGLEEFDWNGNWHSIGS